MKALARVWTFIKRNIDNVLTILVSIGVIILSLLQKVDQQLLSTAILSIMFLIAISLLINREINIHLQETTEKVLDKTRNPPIEEVLKPYNDWIDDIETSIDHAEEVWILSRTCIMIWAKYQPQFSRLLKRKGSLRLMLVDPSDGALRMIADSAKVEFARKLPGQLLKENPRIGSDQLSLLKAQVECFIQNIHAYVRNGNKRIEACLINYLPSHTLIIINGKSENGLMFVELGTFYSSSQGRPAFILHKSHDRQLFDMYYEEYKAMWDSGKTIDFSKEWESDLV